MLTRVTNAPEYRAGELADAAGITVRTLRYYQERKLVPPPRREGRVGWYSERHLARLRVIADLLDRGHTLEGIRELLAAWEKGHDVADVLGLEKAVIEPWSAETPVTLTLDELRELFPGEIDDEALRQAAELGSIEFDGERVTHWSRRQLDASVALVRAGVPLAVVLATARELQRGADMLADMFVRMVMEHVVGDLNERDIGELAETLRALRPGALLTVEIGFGRAMDRRVRAEMERVFGGAAETG